MKTQLRNLLTRGHSVEIKQKALKDLEFYSQSYVCGQYKLTPATLKHWIFFTKEILEADVNIARKLIKKKRIRSEEYKTNYKAKHTPGTARKKHPLKIIARYNDSNYKLVCFRNNLPYIEEDKLSALDLWKLVKKQKRVCALTGLRLTAEDISIDHIVPVSQGGKNRIENIRLVHKEVNRMKGTLSDIDFLSFCKLITLHSQSV